MTILFSEIVGYTEMAGCLDAERLVRLRDTVFSRFDALAAKMGLETIKPIGDADLVVTGLPVTRDDHLAR